MAAVNWTNNLTYMLIDELKCNECIWNKRLTIYRDRNARSVAMQNIISSLQAFLPTITQDDVEKKLRNLRQAFNRDWKKVKDSRRSGAGAAEVYRSTWRYYDALSFLSSAQMEAETEDNMNQELPNVVSAELQLYQKCM